MVSDSAATATAILAGVKTKQNTLGLNQHVIHGNCSSSKGNQVQSVLHDSLKKGKHIYDIESCLNELCVCWLLKHFGHFKINQISCVLSYNMSIDRACYIFSFRSGIWMNYGIKQKYSNTPYFVFYWRNVAFSMRRRRHIGVCYLEYQWLNWTPL